MAKTLTFDRKREGIDHINTYSRSTLEVGRLLSNFHVCPKGVLPFGFLHIEALWLFAKYGLDELCDPTITPQEARKITRGLTPSGEVDKIRFESVISSAITAKLDYYRDWLSADECFARKQLDIVHYWWHNGKSVSSGSGADLIVNTITRWRNLNLIWKL